MGGGVTSLSAGLDIFACGGIGDEEDGVGEGCLPLDRPEKNYNKRFIKCSTRHSNRIQVTDMKISRRFWVRVPVGNKTSSLLSLGDLFRK